MLDAFFCAQAADVADDRGTFGQGGGDGEGGEVEEVLVGDEDFIVIGSQIPRLNKARRINDEIICQNIG